MAFQVCEACSDFSGENVMGNGRQNKSIYYSVRLGFDFITWIRTSILGCGWGEGYNIFSSILLYPELSLHTEF